MIGSRFFICAAHPFDLVGVNVGRRELDRVGQVEDDFSFRGRLAHVEDGFGNFLGEVEFGHVEASGKYSTAFFRPVGARRVVFDLHCDRRVTATTTRPGRC